MRRLVALVGVVSLAFQVSPVTAEENIFDLEDFKKFEKIGPGRSDFKPKIIACDYLDYFLTKSFNESEQDQKKSVLFRPEEDYGAIRAALKTFIGKDYGKIIDNPKTKEWGGKLVASFYGGLGLKTATACRNAYIDMLEFMSQNEPSTKQSESSSGSSDAHKDCLDAKDYEGCMRYKQSSQGQALAKDLCKGSVCLVTTKGSDIYGLPKPFNYKYSQLDDGRLMYWSRFYRIPHKGQEARYIGLERITRYYRTPQAGTSGSFIGGGSASTNCTDYGGSINCTTTGSTPTYIPGSSATPGGIVNAVFTHVFDCKDMTEATYKRGKLSGGWEKYDPEDFYHGMFKKKCAVGTSELEDLPALGLKM